MVIFQLNFKPVITTNIKIPQVISSELLLMIMMMMKMMMVMQWYDAGVE